MIDWAPFTAVLIFYDKTRGAADAVGLPLHEADVVGWERALFGGHVPTVWLQQHLYDPHHVYWYDALFTLIYTLALHRDTGGGRRAVAAAPGVVAAVHLAGHPAVRRRADHLRPVPGGAAVAGRARRLHRRPDRAALGPRLDLAARAEPAEHAGPRPGGRLEPGRGDAVAARRLRLPDRAVSRAASCASRWRYLLWLYPVAMGLTLVYTGEHYVVDLLAGLVYAVAAHLASVVGAAPAAEPAEAPRPRAVPRAVPTALHRAGRRFPRSLPLPGRPSCPRTRERTRVDAPPPPVAAQRDRGRLCGGLCDSWCAMILEWRLAYLGQKWHSVH